MRTPIRRGLRAALAGSLLLGGLATVSLTLSVALPVATASASTVSLFSSTTAGTYAVTVPAGVTSVSITAVGGSGGASINDDLAGGEGGIITSSVAVTPDASLTVTVAANGDPGDGGDSAAYSGSGGSGAGSGGSSGPGTFGGLGGGGGGGSAVFAGATALVVAGGGGGSDQARGGNADESGAGGASAGAQGTLSGPGGGGSSGGLSAPSGSGPNGGGGRGSAGGGGGYFGGGAALDGGGGGGASYPAPATQWDTTATPSVSITYTSADIVTVTNPGTQTSTVGTAVSLQIAATDSESGQTLTYSATGLPAGLSISSSSGLISGTPTSATSNSVTVTATDSTTAFGTASFTWTVNNPANIVTVTNPGTQTSTVGTAVSLQIAATDSESGQTLTYSATGLPAGLSISSSSGLISGTPTSATSNSVTVTATDSTTAFGTASFTWTVNSAVQAHTVTFNANGGVGTMTPEVENAPTTLTKNAFTRAGYSFSGWNTAANGSGTSYANEASYPFASSVILYAQWKISTTTTVGELPFSAPYGAENRVLFFVAVAPTRGLFGPSGDTVTIKVGTTSCVTTLFFGLGACTIGAKALPVGGPDGVSATFGGDASYAGSSSTDAVNFTVTKAV